MRAYKRASNKLQQITSDILSNTKPKTAQEPGPGSSSREQPPVKRRCPDDSEEKPPAKRLCPENKENRIPTILISGGTKHQFLTTAMFLIDFWTYMFHYTSLSLIYFTINISS